MRAAAYWTAYALLAAPLFAVALTSIRWRPLLRAVLRIVLACAVMVAAAILARLCKALARYC